MKNKTYSGKIDPLQAESEYLESLGEAPAGKAKDETLLIKSYALDPSLDEALWTYHEVGSVIRKKRSKRMSAKTHGIIDYVFAAALFTLPTLLRLKNKKTFALLGTATALSGALTKDAQGIKPVLSLTTHRTLDVALLSGLATTAVFPSVRKNKPTLAFTLSMLALGAAAVLLTDWKKPSPTLNRSR